MKFFTYRIFIIFFISTLFFSTANATARQFICTFKGGATISTNGIASAGNLNSSKDEEKFTFIIESKNPLRASYINLKFGEKIPLKIIKQGQAYIFVESNESDNHFLVTIFLDGSKNLEYLALKSFHFAKKVDASDFYAPQIRAGQCVGQVN